jgi:hypothetical protein
MTHAEIWPFLGLKSKNLQLGLSNSVYNLTIALVYLWYLCAQKISRGTQKAVKYTKTGTFVAVLSVLEKR